MPELYAVAVVVDPVFGERLFSIAARMPVWIADTPKNRSAVEQHRARHPGQSGTEGVTTFKVDPDANSEDWCAQVLTNVDLHHGRFSHNPPYSVVEVFGATLTPTLRAALGELGFHFVHGAGRWLSRNVIRCCGLTSA